MNNRIKEIRKYLKLTQAKFAKMIGLKATAIGLYESGDRNVTEQTIMLICSIFNVNEEWLRTGKGEMFNYSENDLLIEKLSSEYKLDDFQRRLVQKYLELTEQQKLAVKSFLDKVYEEEFAILQSSENTDNEFSATEEDSETKKKTEEFPPEYENMSVEEIEKQADFWDSLYEKRQAELDSQRQEEDLRNTESTV